ncbi:MAG: EAL domain-containing protein [Thermoleophilaceae bacterium]
MHERQGSAHAELERLVELSNDLCCVLTQHGVFEWVNPAWERVLGWTPDEIVGRLAFDLIHPDDVASSLEANAGVDMHQVVNFQNRYQHKDGSWRWLLWSATLADDHWYGIAKHVSERRRFAQNRRFRDDRLYRAIIEHTTQGIWAVDAQDRTTFVNRRLAELLGYEQDEMLGRPIYDFMDSEASRTRLRESLLRRRSGVSELREGPILRKDGGLVHVLVEASPLFDERGEYAGAVGMLTDISDRKRSEAQVALLAALTESSTDAIVASSLDGSVQSWNPAAEALFGWSAREIVGRALSTVLPTGDESLLALVDSAARGEFAGPVEIDAVAKDRTRIPVDLTAFPVEGPDGKVDGVAVTMRDVRERREAERKIREGERALGDMERVGRLGTWEWFLDERRAAWSDEVYRIHGLKPDAFVPTRDRVLECAHPEDREQLAGATEHARSAGEPIDIRYRIIRPSGEVRWVHMRAEPVTASEQHGRRMFGTIQDQTQLVLAEENARAARAELRRQALHDPLTSLPNRTLFLDRLTVALAHAERTGTGVAVIVVGLDRFGLVNEELGHAFGDQVLKAVAQRLAGVMRSGDTVGRLSGDEFAIVCESIQPAEQAIDTLAGRIVDGFGEPFAVGGREVFLTASAGIAWTDDGERADTLIRRATSALTAAKERDRGSYVVASPGGRPYAGYGRLALRNALRDAIGCDQLRVVYQPIVAIEDGKPRALEALVRWEHPGLGPVSPLEFIPVAEDTGLIIPIGEWVLRESCRTLAAIDGELSAAVNLSPRQLLQQDLARVVAEALADAKLPAERLILELTESILVEETGKVGHTLAALKELGVKLALDDFGTGYSALGYLKRFPLDIVKVDRSFVHGLGRDEGDSAIVGAVLGMAGALGMEVVAEGVETEEQLACLHELGARYAQGFLFARPLAREELHEALVGRRNGA